MRKSSFSSKVKSLVLSPPFLAAAAFTAALIKYRHGIGMTSVPEVFSMVIYIAVSAIVSVIWAIRVYGCSAERSGNDGEARSRLVEVVVISRVFTGVFVVWNLFSLHYAWGVGSGVLYAHNQAEGGAMVPYSWSAVRLREAPNGRILSVRTEGVFVKPCVAGCVEAVSVHSTKIEELLTLASPDGKGAAVKASAYVQIVEDNDGLEDMALRSADIQEELESRARNALRQCAIRVFASGWSAPGARFDMDCGKDNNLFQLVSPSISG